MNWTYFIKPFNVENPGDNPTYETELKTQAMELEEEIALLTLAHDYVKQNIVTRFSKKALIILIEICFYGIFVVGMVTLIGMSFIDNPLSLSFPMNESIAFMLHVDVKIANTLIFIFKVLLFLFAIWNLMLGLLFRKIRRKNNKLQDVAEMFRALLNFANTRLERIEVLGVKP